MPAFTSARVFTAAEAGGAFDLPGDGWRGGGGGWGRWAPVGAPVPAF